MHVHLRRIVCLLLALLPATLGAVTGDGAPVTRNLFAELLGRSEAEVRAKQEEGFRQLFHGDNDTQRLYYPVGTDMAYLADVGSGDVRTEGMSYGMMIAVQMGKREEFDRLWKWVKTYMWHSKGDRAGYFAWHCRLDGTQLDPGSASDGEEWFAMALLFASHRWGDGEGIFNYGAEARALLSVMVHKNRWSVRPLFDPRTKLVVFSPTLDASRYTDPSYHLPAFLELWSLWADPKDRSFWREACEASRAYLHRAAHPVTGLMPEYSEFDGTPSSQPEKGDFRFDAWRILGNVALDHAWFGRDPWQVEQSNRILRFLTSQGGPRCPNQFTLDGRPLSSDNSIGLVAMAAVAGLAADKELARPFVERLWTTRIPSGQWRYYDGLLYQFALLQAGGSFRAFMPADGIPRP
jgi:oligosaccharide reducing-end xylanase